MQAAFFRMVCVCNLNSGTKALFLAHAGIYDMQFGSSSCDTHRRSANKLKYAAGYVLFINSRGIPVGNEAVPYMFYIFHHPLCRQTCDTARHAGCMPFAFATLQEMGDALTYSAVNFV
ncbi:hypothetical protein Droror1_Dr00024788 [Drosera rotundifolia]